MNVVLDSSVLIDVIRGTPQAVAYAESLDRIPFCSEITRVEVLRGLREAERPTAERLFEQLRWIVVDEAIARRAGELGRRWASRYPGIGSADLVIAATAQELGADLATGNIRHFPMFSGLRRPYRS